MCNQSRVFWKHHTGDLLNLSQHAIEEAWTSPTRHEIRQALLSGQRHPNCVDCWNEEAAGRRSRRIIFNEQFAKTEPLHDQPRVIILKPGNACNLTCRHCAPHTSSGWYRDYYAVEYQGGGSFADFVKTFESARLSYHDDSTLWQTLRGWSDKVVYWDLYGAEPLVIQPLLNLLRHTADQGHAVNQQIYINTNGTIWRDEFIETFARFQSVHIGISIDGIGQQFEYMRYPAEWDHLTHNLDRYQMLAQTHSTVHIDVCITASLLNVWYLPEYLDFFADRGIAVGINLLHAPEHLNMRIASQRVKDLIVAKFENYAKLSAVSNFLCLPMPNSSTKFDQFIKITKSYDKARNQNYADVFPEFWNIMKSDFVDCDQ
jgi:sulfatase maturation enzyme AslB (radical SAM superfamily)